MADGDFEEQLRQEQLEKDDDANTAYLQTRVDDDGTVFEFDPVKRAWFPKIDEDFLAQYQMNYGSSTESSAADATSNDTTQQTTEAETPDHADFYRSYYEAIERGELVAGDSKAYYDFYVSYYKQKCADNNAGTTDVVEQDKTSEKGNEDTDETDTPQTIDNANKPSSVNFAPTGNEEYDEYWKHYFENCYQEPDGDEEKHAKRSKLAKQNENAAKKTAEPVWFEMDQKKNTSVYVSGLPPDITDDAFKELMNKYGLIVCDPQSRRLKIKLYRDENGETKGDGLCSYIKMESVDLALQLLDGYKMGSHTLSVKPAEFVMKGEFDAKKKKKKLTNKEKRRAKKQQERLFEWRLEKLSGETVRKKHERVIIVKNLFTPMEFEKDALLIKKTQTDLQAECCKYGAIVNVTIHDHHPEGVASVTFKMVDGADACREALDGRYFGRRLLDAKTWDGKTNYNVKETAEEREKRLKKWAEYLEGDDTKAKDSNVSNNEGSSTSRIKNDLGADKSKIENKVDNTAESNVATNTVLSSTCTDDGHASEDSEMETSDEHDEGCDNPEPVNETSSKCNVTESDSIEDNRHTSLVEGNSKETVDDTSTV